MANISEVANLVFLLPLQIARELQSTLIQIRGFGISEK